MTRLVMDFNGKGGRRASSKPIKVVIAKGIISFMRIVATVVERSILGGLPKKELPLMALGRLEKIRRLS